MDDLLSRISLSPTVMAGQPVIRGTSFTVSYILGLLARGATVEEVLAQHEGLTPEDIQACQGFAALQLDGSAVPLPAAVTGAREIESDDGFVRYRCCPTPQYALERLRQTKEIQFTNETIGLAFAAAKLSPAAVCGALWHLFGPPHDLIDDWKQSFAFFFDVIVDPSKRDPALTEPVMLLLRAADWKGSMDVQLRMPLRDARDDVLEDGERILPGKLQATVMGFFIGYLEGYIETGPLHDFERRFPSSAGGGRYGVRDGVPFEGEEPAEEEPSEPSQ